MKQTLRRLDRTFDVLFQKDQCNHLSSEVIGNTFEEIEILMQQYEAQIELMRREMKRFAEYVAQEGSFRKMGRFGDMCQRVAILYYNFKDVIKPLMKFRTVSVVGSPGTTIQIRRIEQTYGEKIEWQFKILQRQTSSLTLYLAPRNGRPPLLPIDTTYFSEILTTLNTIMRSLESKLLEVCAEDSDSSDSSD